MNKSSRSPACQLFELWLLWLHFYIFVRFSILYTLLGVEKETKISYSDRSNGQSNLRTRVHLTLTTSRASPRDVPRDTFREEKGRRRAEENVRWLEDKREARDWPFLVSALWTPRYTADLSLVRGDISWLFFLSSLEVRHTLHEYEPTSARVIGPSSFFFLFFFSLSTVFLRCIVTRWPIAVDRGSRGRH